MPGIPAEFKSVKTKNPMGDFVMIKTDTKKRDNETDEVYISRLRKMRDEINSKSDSDKSLSWATSLKGQITKALKKVKQPPAKQEQEPSEPSEPSEQEEEQEQEQEQEQEPIVAVPTKEKDPSTATVSEKIVKFETRETHLGINLSSKDWKELFELSKKTNKTVTSSYGLRENYKRILGTRVKQIAIRNQVPESQVISAIKTYYESTQEREADAKAQRSISSKSTIKTLTPSGVSIEQGELTRQMIKENKQKLDDEINKVKEEANNNTNRIIDEYKRQLDEVSKNHESIMDKQRSQHTRDLDKLNKRIKSLQQKISQEGEKAEESRREIEERTIQKIIESKQRLIETHKKSTAMMKVKNKLLVNVLKKREQKQISTSKEQTKKLIDTIKENEKKAKEERKKYFNDIKTLELKINEENKQRQQLIESSTRERDLLIAGETKKRDELIADETKKRDELIAEETKKRELLIARQIKERQLLIAKQTEERDLVIYKALSSKLNNIDITIKKNILESESMKKKLSEVSERKEKKSILLSKSGIDQLIQTIPEENRAVYGTPVRNLLTGNFTYNDLASGIIGVSLFTATGSPSIASMGTTAFNFVRNLLGVDLNDLFSTTTAVQSVREEEGKKTQREVKKKDEQLKQLEDLIKASRAERKTLETESEKQLKDLQKEEERKRKELEKQAEKERKELEKQAEKERKRLKISYKISEVARRKEVEQRETAETKAIQSALQTDIIRLKRDKQLKDLQDVIKVLQQEVKKPTKEREVKIQPLIEKQTELSSRTEQPTFKEREVKIQPLIEKQSELSSRTEQPTFKEREVKIQPLIEKQSELSSKQEVLLSRPVKKIIETKTIDNPELVRRLKFLELLVQEQSNQLELQKNIEKNIQPYNIPIMEEKEYVNVDMNDPDISLVSSRVGVEQKEEKEEKEEKKTKKDNEYDKFALSLALSLLNNSEDLSRAIEYIRTAPGQYIRDIARMIIDNYSSSVMGVPDSVFDNALSIARDGMSEGGFELKEVKEVSKENLNTIVREVEEITEPELRESEIVPLTESSQGAYSNIVQMVMGLLPSSQSIQERATTALNYISQLGLDQKQRLVSIVGGYSRISDIPIPSFNSGLDLIGESMERMGIRRSPVQDLNDIKQNIQNDQKEIKTTTDTPSPTLTPATLSEGARAGLIAGAISAGLSTGSAMGGVAGAVPGALAGAGTAGIVRPFLSGALPSSVRARLAASGLTPAQQTRLINIMKYVPPVIAGLYMGYTPSGKTEDVAGAGVVSGAGITEKKITVTPDVLAKTKAQLDQEHPFKNKVWQPKAITPTPDILDESKQEKYADDVEFIAFNYIPPTSEGAEGTVDTNPLKYQQLLESKIRYTDAGVYIPYVTWNKINDANNMTKERLQTMALGPKLPEMKFETFDNDTTFENVAKLQFVNGENTAVEFQSPYSDFSNVENSWWTNEDNELYTINA